MIEQVKIMPQGEDFGYQIPPRSRHFSDPAPPRYAAKAKLALRAQTVAFAGAPLRGQGFPENLNERFQNPVSPLCRTLGVL
jgi:hypothetical protein